MKRSGIRKFSQAIIAKLKRKLKIRLHALIRKEYPTCYTCPSPTAHAGHYKPAGLYKSAEFDPRNIRGQCVKCNNFMSGRLDVYGDKLREELGDKEYKAMVSWAQKGKFKYTVPILEALIAAAEVDLETYTKVYFQIIKEQCSGK